LAFTHIAKLCFDQAALNSSQITTQIVLVVLTTSALAFTYIAKRCFDQAALNSSQIITQIVWDLFWWFRCWLALILNNHWNDFVLFLTFRYKKAELSRPAQFGFLFWNI